MPSEARIADVAQSVERRLGKAEVTGPIPVISFVKVTLKGLNIGLLGLFSFMTQSVFLIFFSNYFSNPVTYRA